MRYKNLLLAVLSFNLTNIVPLKRLSGFGLPVLTILAVSW